MINFAVLVYRNQMISNSGSYQVDPEGDKNTFALDFQAHVSEVPWMDKRAVHGMDYPRVRLG